jgi:hypothetical protein
MATDTNSTGYTNTRTTAPTIAAPTTMATNTISTGYTNTRTTAPTMAEFTDTTTVDTVTGITARTAFTTRIFSARSSSLSRFRINNFDVVH